MNLNNQQDDAWSPNEVSQLLTKEKITNTHLKSKRSESDFNWRCVYFLKTWQRRNFCDRNEVIPATETLRKPVSNCNLQHRTVKAFCLVNTKQLKGSQHLDRDRPHLFWPQSRWQYAWFSWTCSSRTVSSLDRGSWKISRWFSGVW